MTTTDMTWIPSPLYHKLKLWCREVPNGQILLTLRDGKIVEFTLIECGRVRYTPQGVRLEPSPPESVPSR